MSDADVLVENYRPGVMERFGLGYEQVRAINPRLIYASIKGFGPGPYVHFKAYETIAQAMGGSMSTTGFEEGPPTSTGAQIGDSGTGVHTLAAILAALYQRVSTGRGQRVEVAMQDAVLNLCRVKVRDQQRLQHGPLPEYPSKSFGDAVPRTGNASGGGQPGGALKCKPGGPNDYIYVIIQPHVWPALAKLIGHSELIDDPEYATPEARLNKLDRVFGTIEAWTQRYTKFQAMELLNEIDVPCGPILDIRELVEDKALAERGLIVEVEHPQRGVFKTISCPLVLSDSPVDVRTSPLLGEHTDEILHGLLGYSQQDIEELRATGVI
jgi:formyl-CoA transferase